MGKTVNDKRPVNLDISSIQLPLPALVSILTRLSGIFLFVATGLLLWLLDMSLGSADGFARARTLLASPLVGLAVWAIVAALIYHALSGIRHLLADCGYGETLQGGLLGARLVLLTATLSIALAGVWLW